MDYIEVYKETNVYNVLFVEDDLNFQKETLDILTQLFKHVTIANNGKEALDKYQRYYQKNNSYYDIVISDIKMPQMDGIELTKEIYTINQKQAIIMLSAHNESDYLMQLINMGIKQFLMKPLDIDKLFNILYKVSLELKDIKNIPTQEQVIIQLSNGHTWNKKTLILRDKEKAIKLSNYERKLLEVLIKNNNRATTHEELLDSVWKEKKFEVSPNVVKGTISRMRTKAPKLLIENISKLGYRLIF